MEEHEHSSKENSTLPSLNYENNNIFLHLNHVWHFCPCSPNTCKRIRSLRFWNDTLIRQTRDRIWSRNLS